MICLSVLEMRPASRYPGASQDFLIPRPWTSSNNLKGHSVAARELLVIWMDHLLRNHPGLELLIADLESGGRLLQCRALMMGFFCDIRRPVMTYMLLHGRHQHQ